MAARTHAGGRPAPTIPIDYPGNVAINPPSFEDIFNGNSVGGQRPHPYNEQPVPGMRTIEELTADLYAELDEDIAAKRQGKQFVTESPQENKKPLNDIQFDVRRRGYDRSQVAAYIDDVTVSYNRICQQNAELQKRIQTLEAEIHALRESTDIVTHARELADHIIADANAEASRITRGLYRGRYVG
ncbi:MAG: DivIVA domain-containing protein [Oscillospiraceae bacterium]|jgi:DivIVA domain-containing protein|nr:DivIVA domain-containing protein [Oscillospiraceae bacterium]